MSNRHTESKKTQLEFCPCLLAVRVGPCIHWPSSNSGLVPSAAKIVKSGRGGLGHQGNLLFAEGTAGGWQMHKSRASWHLVLPGDHTKGDLRSLGEYVVPSPGGRRFVCCLLCCMEGQEVPGISSSAQSPACRPTQGAGSLLAKVTGMGRPQGPQKLLSQARVSNAASQFPSRFSSHTSSGSLQPGLLC